MMARAIVPFLSAAALLALQGCAHQAPRPSAPVYAIDFQGAAKQCTVPKQVDLQPGKTADATMAVTNDGGWCAIAVAQSGPEPYAAGLLTGRPAHGKVYIHPVGDQTRIDYTPETGFGGTDQFEVKLIPGDEVLRVAVTVQGPAGGITPAAATAPAPSPEPKAKAKTHSKKK
jgi:hypothetical protein